MAHVEDTNEKQSTADRRIAVTFTPEAYEALETLARRKGKSMADVLRDALALEKWLDDARASGDRFLIERNGQLRELLLR